MNAIPNGRCDKELADLYFLYIITNVVNGKQYVGYTKRLWAERRLRQHFYPSAGRGQSRLARAIRKYGDGAFETQVIDVASNHEQAKTFERRLIALLDTQKRGYNCTPGGDGGCGGTTEACRNGGRAQGLRNVKSGHLDRIKGMGLRAAWRNNRARMEEVRKLSDDAKRGAHWYHNSATGQEKLLREPGLGWAKGRASR